MQNCLAGQDRESNGHFPVPGFAVVAGHHVVLALCTVKLFNSTVLVLRGRRAPTVWPKTRGGFYFLCVPILTSLNTTHFNSNLNEF
jgi:hypothetical protein